MTFQRSSDLSDLRFTHKNIVSRYLCCIYQVFMSFLLYIDVIFVFEKVDDKKNKKLFSE